MENGRFAPITMNKMVITIQQSGMRCTCINTNDLSKISQIEQSRVDFELPPLRLRASALNTFHRRR